MPSDDGRREKFRFGAFELDPVARELRCSGRPVHVQPRVFSLIHFLVIRPGRAISRDELLHSLWEEASVEDGSLSRAIRGARAALGADPDLGGAIHTVRGFGYRFDARVEGGPTDRARADGGLGEEADATGRGTFVGRGDALEGIARAAARAETGERAVVLVLGAPGIGKTTLVRHALARGSGERVTGLGQSIEDFGATTPYAPVLEALVDLARSAPAPVCGALAAEVRRAAPSWVGHLPLLFGDEDVARPALELRPDQMSREMIDAIELVARDRPIAIWIEDLHWADQSTLRLVETLASRSGAAKLLLICTMRSNEIAASDGLRRLRAKLSRLRSGTEIELGPLSRQSVRDYVDRVLGASGRRGAGLAEHVVDWLTSRTEGNPLFLSQLVEYLRALGLLAPDDGSAITTRMLEDAGLPDTLTTLLHHWADDLDPQDRSVLEAASIAGIGFDVRVLSAALGQTASEVEASCDRLVQGGWAEFRGFDTWSDGTRGATLRFSHALYARALADRVPPIRRSVLHRRIAERLAAGHADDAAYASTIASHFDRAGARVEAARHRVAAAVHAASQQAVEEAILHAGRGLEELDRLDLDEVERHRAAFDLHMSFARALAARDGFAEESVEQHFARALEHAVASDDAAGEIASTWGLSACLQMRGELDAAREVAERLLRLAEKAGDPATVQYAVSLLTIIAYFQGRFLECARLGRACLDACERGSGDTLLPHAIQDTQVTVGIYAALAHWHLGRAEEGRALIEAAYRRARSLDHPFTESLAEAFMAIFAFCEGNGEAQREHARRGRAVAERAGIGLWSKVSRFMEICAGPVDDAALGELRSTLAGMAGSGALGGTFFIGLLADLELAHGSRDNVRELCTLGRVMAERTTENNNLPVILLAAARVAEDEAERADHLEQATEWAERLGSIAFAERVRIARRQLEREG